MRHILVRAAALGVCGLVLFSCSPKTTGIVLLDTEATPAGTLVSMVRRQAGMLRSLEGRGTLSFDSPQMSGTAWFTSAMKRPDSLLVQLEGPFGIDVGTLFLSREQYVMYNSLENRVTTGVPGAKSLRGVIPFDLTYDQLVDAFAGMFTPPPEAGVPQTYTVEDGQFFLSCLCDSTFCDYWIDPEFLLVTRFRRRGAGDRVLVDATASSITRDGNVAAPKRITIGFPGDHRHLSIAYSSMSLNPDGLSFLFSIPPNAETSVR